MNFVAEKLRPQEAELTVRVSAMQTNLTTLGRPVYMAVRMWPTPAL